MGKIITNMIFGNVLLCINIEPLSTLSSIAARFKNSIYIYICKYAYIYIYVY